MTHRISHLVLQGSTLFSHRSLGQGSRAHSSPGAGTSGQWAVLPSRETCPRPHACSEWGPALEPTYNPLPSAFLVEVCPQHPQCPAPCGVRQGKPTANKTQGPFRVSATEPDGLISARRAHTPCWSSWSCVLELFGEPEQTHRGALTSALWPA